jgi:hypothetical protein
MTLLWVNIPLMVLFVALWVGIPTWLVLKHPDQKPTLAAAPALRNLPYRLEARRSEDAGYRSEDAGYRSEDAGYRRVA